MTRNPIAKALRTPRFKERSIKSKKAYSRKLKHKGKHDG